MGLPVQSTNKHHSLLWKGLVLKIPSPILVIVMTGIAVTAPRTKYRMDERRSDNCRTKL